MPTLLILLLLMTAPPLAAQSRVTIYRCEDGFGKVSLSDRPCPAQQQEKQREMRYSQGQAAVAPAALMASQNGPVTPAPVVPSVRAIEPAVRVYECQGPDGERYESASPEGRLRWQPLWIPVQRGRMLPGGQAQLRYSGRAGDVALIQQAPAIWVPGSSGYSAPLPGAGSWVADRCQPLPQARICQRWRDRQSEIRRRYAQVMPSERQQMAEESRQLAEQLARECGG